MRECASVVWDPHQQQLKSTLERWHNEGQPAASFMTLAPPQVTLPWFAAQLQLKNLQSSRMSDKVCMMYKIMNGFVNIEPCCRSARGQKPQLQGAQMPTPKSPTQEQTCTCILIPIRNPALEICPHRWSISHDSTCLQICTDRMDGHS